MSDEISRILSAARRAAPDVPADDVKKITRAVLEAIDALIDENPDDSTWPDADDLGLLAADL